MCWQGRAPLGTPGVGGESSLPTWQQGRQKGTLPSDACSGNSLHFLYFNHGKLHRIDCMFPGLLEHTVCLHARSGSTLGAPAVIWGSNTGLSVPFGPRATVTDFLGLLISSSLPLGEAGPALGAKLTAHSPLAPRVSCSSPALGLVCCRLVN